MKSDRPPDLKGNGSLLARVYERRSRNHCHYQRLNNFQRDSLKLVARRSELCHKCVWSKQLKPCGFTCYGHRTLPSHFSMVSCNVHVFAHCSSAFYCTERFLFCTHLTSEVEKFSYLFVTNDLAVLAPQKLATKALVC